MKPSEVLLQRVMAIHEEQLNGHALSTTGGGSPSEAHRSILVAHAVRRAAGELFDELFERLAKLEAAHPKARDIVGSTASGEMVHGLAITGPDTVGPADASTPERMRVTVAGVAPSEDVVSMGRYEPSEEAE